MGLRALSLAAALALVTSASAAIVRTAHGQYFTEPTGTVGRGGLQLEFNYLLGVDHEDGTIGRTHSWGEPLIRVGALSDRLELSVGAGLGDRGHGFPRGRTATDARVEDLYLGVKLALTGQRGILPATAVLPQATIPTGSEVLSAGRSLPGVNFLYSWDLTETVSFVGSSQVNAAVGDEDEDYREWAHSLSCGVALGERAGIYGEWYALVPRGIDGPAGRVAEPTEHYVNTGLAWTASDDLEWGVWVGLGVSDAAEEDAYVGAGVVWRVR